jgi:nucleolar pre-ribosomal-associated protein 1
MPNIYNHIASDPAITVYRVLTAIWTAITDSTPGISRRISLVLLNESSIENLLGLLNRKEIERSTGSTIGEMATGFLEGVTTDPGRGLCFADEGWYPRQVEEKENDDEDDGRIRKDDKERQSLHNRILSNVVRRTGARVVDGDGKLGDMISKILEACPELVAG